MRVLAAPAACDNGPSRGPSRCCGRDEVEGALRSGGERRADASSHSGARETPGSSHADALHDSAAKGGGVDRHTEADGTMAPIVETSHAPAGIDRRKHYKVCWKEVKVLVASALKEVSSHYDATLGGVAETGPRWSRMVEAAGWDRETRIHVVGDGAHWLAQQAAECFGPQGRYLLDLFHVCEHLSEVCPRQKDVIHAHRDALKAGDLDSVLHALRAEIESAGNPVGTSPRRSHASLPRKPPGSTRLPLRHPCQSSRGIGPHRKH